VSCLLPIVWIYEELSEGAGLTGPVPAVRTVNYHRYSLQQGGPDELRGLQHCLAVPKKGPTIKLLLKEDYALKNCTKFVKQWQWHSFL